MPRYVIETTNLASGPESLGLSYHGPPTAEVSGSGIDGGGVRERDRACEKDTLENLKPPCKSALPRAGVDVWRWRPQPATCSDCRCGCIMIIFMVGNIGLRRRFFAQYTRRFFAQHTGPRNAQMNSRRAEWAAVPHRQAVTCPRPYRQAVTCPRQETPKLSQLFSWLTEVRAATPAAQRITAAAVKASAGAGPFEGHLSLAQRACHPGRIRCSGNRCWQRRLCHLGLR